MKQSGRMAGLSACRKLLAGSMAYLSGIYLTEVFCIPGCVAAILSVLFLGAAFVCFAQRRSALFFVLAFLAIFGNWRTAGQLCIRDEATVYGVTITGTVSKIVSDNRVYLEDVQIDEARRLNRHAVVTLMGDKDENGNPIGETIPVFVGQRISGTGRLFEPDMPRNPGEADGRVNALCSGYELSGYLVSGWQVQGEARFSIHEAFRLAREALSMRLERLFGDMAPLFQAVMLGNRANMDDEVVQAMRLTGIAHLLTVSGMHLSLIAGATHWALGRLRLRRGTAFCLQVLLLGGFACLTGGAAGTVRAYIMAVMREMAACLGRRYDALTALGSAALLMTLVNPLWALSASFQFSFFVVLGILLLSRQLAKPVERYERCPYLLKRAVQTVALSASAQLAALPMQLAFYGYIPLLALPMNLLSGAMMPLVMLGGWLALITSVVLPVPAAWFAGMLGKAASLLEGVSLLGAAQTFGIARMPAPYMASLILFAALMFAGSRQVRIGRVRSQLCLLLSGLLVLLYLPRLNPAAQYVQLDVGQGDGAVIRQGRHAVLIDVGPENEYAALRYLRREGLYVDLVILSHLDEDHAGGLGVLLASEISIGAIALAVDAEDEVDSGAVAAALDSARAAGIPIQYYQAGDTIRTDAFSFSVLSPDAALSGSNERSLVLYGNVGGMRVLTLGDLPAESEMDVVPECDVLKVAHHGSRYATSKALIEQAKPAVALISVGANSYGHPTDRVLLDLAQAGADVYRTDESGCLTVMRRGDTCVVTTFVK